MALARQMLVRAIRNVFRGYSDYMSVVPDVNGNSIDVLSGVAIAGSQGGEQIRFGLNLVRFIGANDRSMAVVHARGEYAMRHVISLDPLNAAEAQALRNGPDNTQRHTQLAIMVRLAQYDPAASIIEAEKVAKTPTDYDKGIMVAPSQ